MRDVVTRLYIFSVFIASNSTRINNLAHSDVFETLRAEGLNPVDIDGVYKGNSEASIALSGGPSLEMKLKEICEDHEQESFLIVYGDRSCELVFLDGNREFVGTWRETPESEAKNKDHSFINGVYYTIGPKSVEYETKH